MRYLIGLVIFILLILFVIIKLISGGGSEKQLPPSLASYADTATTVRFTIDNPVQAPDTHRDIIIEVGNSSTDVTITKGYDGEIVKSESFPMTESAYAHFLLSLDRSGGYTLGNNDKNVQDERGYCATGNRYLYDIISGDGTRIQRLWSTTCGTKTFKGQEDVVQKLFESMVPNFDLYTEDISF